MTDYAATHSVAHAALGRQTQTTPYNFMHVGRLGIALLYDARLRARPLGVAVLAGLIVYGAADQLTEVPLKEVAADLGSTYDGVYKAVQRLRTLGYVKTARAQSGQRRVSLRVVWPEAIATAGNPTKRSKKS